MCEYSTPIPFSTLHAPFILIHYRAASAKSYNPEVN